MKTLEWEDNKLKLIDQTKLPDELTYVYCNDYKEVIVAIKDMIVRGAPAIGVAAAFGMALADLHGEDLDNAADEIKAARIMLKDYNRGKLLFVHLRPDYDPEKHGIINQCNVKYVLKSDAPVKSFGQEENKVENYEDLEEDYKKGRYNPFIEYINNKEELKQRVDRLVSMSLGLLSSSIIPEWFWPNFIFYTLFSNPLRMLGYFEAFPLIKELVQ